MKKLFKKVVSLGLSAALTVTMMITGTVNASAAYYYNTYSTVADIATRSSCGAMQGMAVGSTWLYTVKIKSDNSQAILKKTNKNTGATTNLTDSNGSSTYSYLNHANDMDVTTIDGYSQLFVATMATGSNSLVRMKIDGSKATKEGSYTLMLNGAEKSVSGVAVEKTDADNVYLLLKSGATLYRATIPKTKKSGIINITYAFKIDMSSVRVNGSNVLLGTRTVNISDIMPNGINLSESEITLDVGQSRVVTATVLPENANARSFDGYILKSTSNTSGVFGRE